MAVSGANFGVAETGTVCVVESEGNGRMCTTLPEVLVTVMGIEKVLPEWRDLEVFLQLLPRSSTGERMNPYTSLWTGVRAGDGPREFHLVLLDDGRTDVLADEVGRQALHCIRCSACLNVCPVYSRTGGHAYESVYPGPIGAILTPQLQGLDQRADAAVGLEPVRRLLRGLPGEDRHPARARAPARRAWCASTRAGRSPERAGDGGARARVRARAGATSARSGSRGWAAGRWRRLPRPAARLDRDARAARGRRRRRFREWWRTRMSDARDGVLGPRSARRSARRRPAPRPRCRARYAAPGAAGRRGAVELLLRARGGVPRDRQRGSPATSSRRALAAVCRERGARRSRAAGRAVDASTGVELVRDDPPLDARRARRAWTAC